MTSTNHKSSLSGVYIDDLVNNFESPVKHYDQVSDALTVLRETLSEEEDNSVVIVSLGFLHNIAQLLKSPADDISSLSGFELVRRKVDKDIHIIGVMDKLLNHQIG